MRAYRGLEVQLHPFSTWVVDGGECMLQATAVLHPEKNPGT